jgi:hypothetical protein
MYFAPFAVETFSSLNAPEKILSILVILSFDFRMVTLNP